MSFKGKKSNIVLGSVLLIIGILAIQKLIQSPPTNTLDWAKTLGLLFLYFFCGTQTVWSGFKFVTIDEGKDKITLRKIYGPRSVSISGITGVETDKYGVVLFHGPKKKRFYIFKANIAREDQEALMTFFQKEFKKKIKSKKNK